MVSWDVGVAWDPVYGDRGVVCVEVQHNIIDVPGGLLSWSLSSAGGSGNGCLVICKDVNVASAEVTSLYVFLVGEETFIDSPKLSVEDLHHVAHGDDRSHGMGYAGQYGVASTCCSAQL
jgi:hypothetical protein